MSEANLIWPFYSFTQELAIWWWAMQFRESNSLFFLSPQNVDGFSWSV